MFLSKSGNMSYVVNMEVLNMMMDITTPII